MDAVFWMGLILGALISLPISIIANIWADPVRELLHKRRRIRYSKTRSRELRRYFYVKALREGDPTSRILFDIESTQASRLDMFTILAMCCILVSFVALGLPNGRSYQAYILGFGGIFAALASELVSWRPRFIYVGSRSKVGFNVSRITKRPFP